MNKKIITGRFLVLLTMSFILVLSACGMLDRTDKLSFTMTDFAFHPNEFNVEAGTEITIRVTHDGTMEHNFIVMKYGTDAGEVFDETDKVNVFWEVDLQPGDSKTIRFTAPEQPGTYQIICGMPGHLQSGMIGRMIVTGDQK